MLWYLKLDTADGRAMWAVVQGRFAEAALAAGAELGNQELQQKRFAAGMPPGLLEGRWVHVHVAEGAKKGSCSGNGGPLRRLVAALGGKV